MVLEPSTGTEEQGNLGGGESFNKVRKGHCSYALDSSRVDLSSSTDGYELSLKVHRELES